MKNRGRRLTELSMMVAVPIITYTTKNSKLDGILRKLHNTALDQLYIMRAKQSDIERTTLQLRIWAERSGWNKHHKHNAAIQSFCICLIKRSPEDYGKKINDLIYKLGNHMKRVDALLTIEQCGGKEAIDNWAEQYKPKPVSEIKNTNTIH